MPAIHKVNTTSKNKTNRIESSFKEQLSKMLSKNISDTNNIIGRMDELLALKKGWFDGKIGEILPRDKTIVFKDFFLYNRDFYRSKPFIFPTIDGGLLIEWTINDMEVSLTVNLKDFTGTLFYYQEKTDFEKEIVYNLNDMDEWKKLGVKLRTFNYARRKRTTKKTL